MATEVKVTFPDVLTAVMVMNAMEREGESAQECAISAERRGDADAAACFMGRATRCYAARDAISAGLDAWTKAGA